MNQVVDVKEIFRFLMAVGVLGVLFTACGAQDPRQSASRFGEKPNGPKYVSNEVLNTTGTLDGSGVYGAKSVETNDGLFDDTNTRPDAASSDSDVVASVPGDAVDANVEPDETDSSSTENAPVAELQQSIRVEVLVEDFTMLGLSVCFLKHPGSVISLMSFLPATRVVGALVAWIPGIGGVLSSTFGLGAIMSTINQLIDILQNDSDNLTSVVPPEQEDLSPIDKAIWVLGKGICQIDSRVRIGGDTIDGWNEVTSTQPLSSLVGENISVEMRDRQFYRGLLERLGVTENTDWLDPIVGDCRAQITEDDIALGQIEIPCTERYTKIIADAFASLNIGEIVGKAFSSLNSKLDGVLDGVQAGSGVVQTLKEWKDWLFGSENDDSEDSETQDVRATTFVIRVLFSEI